MTEDKQQQDTPLADSSHVDSKASKPKNASRVVPGKTEVPQDAELLMVPLDVLRLAPDRPGKAVDTSEDSMRVTDANVTDLRKSGQGINASGILQPLSVVSDPEKGEGYFLIVDGAQRWSAARLAGVPAVPILVDKSPGSKDTFETALMMNIVRQNMNVVDEAEALYALMKRMGDTTSLAKVAVRLGIAPSKGWGQNRKELAECSDELKSIVRENSSTFSHVVQVLRKVEDEPLRTKLIEMTREGASVKQLKEYQAAAQRREGEEPKPQSEAQKRALLSQRSGLVLEYLDYYVKEYAHSAKTEDFVAVETKRLLDAREKLNTALHYLNYQDD